MKDRERKPGTDIKNNIDEKTDHGNQENLTSPLPPILFFRYPDSVVPLPEALPVCLATLTPLLAAAAKVPDALCGCIPSQGCSRGWWVGKKFGLVNASGSFTMRNRGCATADASIFDAAGDLSPKS